MVFKVKPMYKHLCQKVNFCGPTCLQMILFRRGYWLSQELLAQKIGVGIDKKDKDLYLLDFPEFSNGDSRIGIALKDFEKQVNPLLKEYGLKCKVYRPSQLTSLREFIERNIKANNDIIINFWLKPFDGRGSGHFVLIADFDEKTWEVTICDSSNKKKSFWKANIEKFVEAMHQKWDGDERGFVVISKI